MPERVRLQSRLTTAVLQALGSEIERARKVRKFSQAELATRVGCSRNTIRSIESGAPTVDIGTFLEAAVILGVPLLGGDGAEIADRTARARREIELLPQPKTVKRINDDF